MLDNSILTAVRPGIVLPLAVAKSCYHSKYADAKNFDFSKKFDDKRESESALIIF